MKEKKKSKIRFIVFKDFDDLELVRGEGVENAFPVHLHNKYCIGFIEKGNAIFTHKGNEYFLSPGSIYFINPREPHHLKPVDKDGFNHIVLSFGERFVSNNFAVKDSEISLVFNTVLINNLSVLDKIELFFKEVNKSEGSKAEYLLMLILSEIYEVFSFDKPYDTPSGADNVKKVAEQLEQYPEEALSLQAMAALAGLSKFHFLRLFKDIVGIPPYDYQIQQKIKLARKLLLEGNSASYTSVELGFTDQSHFSRFFKRYTGTSPGEFVKLNLKL